MSESTPKPDNEKERLESLYEYGVLDTNFEEAFDSLTLLASQICEVPICLISLIDAERQWFKSRVGLDVEETPREYAFCRYAILEDKILEIQDATGDERVKDNPLVTGDPNIRFYAGTPLTTPKGFNLGTLCVIDRSPKKLTNLQKQALETLGHQVVNLLELRLRSKHLEQANLELERSNKDLDEFAYVASHDINAPVRAIQNLAGWIMEESEDLLPDGSLNNLKLLQQRAKRLQKLLEDLLEYARVGKPERATEIVEVNLLIDDVIDLVNSGSEFQFEIAPALPSLALPRVPLEKIFRNLIYNAIRHHDKDSGTIQVSAQELGDDLIEFVVTDDGPGIPSEYQKQIFEMFKTLKPRDEVEGSGMGLSFVKKGVEGWGGKISVESQGRGTTFRFSVPKSLS